jgi:hypothetical protein
MSESCADDNYAAVTCYSYYALPASASPKNGYDSTLTEFLNHQSGGFDSGVRVVSVPRVFGLNYIASMPGMVGGKAAYVENVGSEFLMAIW